MDAAQYYLLARGIPKQLTVELLKDRTPRTLVYGFDCSRNTWHLYLTEEGKFQRVLYDTHGFLVDAYTFTEIKPEEAVPDKRIYAEKSDFEFCQLLLNSGVAVPFASYAHAVQGLWQGKRLEELSEADPQFFEVTVGTPWESISVPTDDPAYPLLFARRFAYIGAATCAVETQTENYLRTWVKGQPDETLLTCIPVAVETAINTELKRHALNPPRPLPEGLQGYCYRMPAVKAEALVAAARAAVMERTSLPRAA